MPKKLVLDVDLTLTRGKPDGVSYSDVEPRWDVVQRVHQYQQEGFEVILLSARGMRTYANSVGKLNANVLPELIGWLDRHGIPYDEVHIGKPWCGHEGFYVDDRAVRPSEFLRWSREELQTMLTEERRLAETGEELE